jgi:phenylacetate-CoA ligase
MIRSRLVGSSIFRFATMLRGESSMFPLLKFYKELERSTPADIQHHVSGKLAQILKYASQNSPKYQRLIDADIPINDAMSLLRKLPETSKEELRSVSSGLRVSDPNLRVHSKTTGGSTGQPVTVWKDSVSVAHERAVTWAFYQSYGISIGDRSVRFWGWPTTLSRRLKSSLADLAMNRRTFSAFAFSEEHLEGYWRTCAKLRPPFYYGYASMLAAFSEFLIATNRTDDELGAKVAVSTSEVLGPGQRRSIARALGCIVRNEYGCGEVGPIAYECDKGMLHVSADSVFVEVVTSDGALALPGEAGRVLVTDLNNRAMPLLRYATGDYAEVGNTCDCGRNTPTLKRIWGREYDFIQTPDGRRFHGEFFLYLFEDLAQSGHEIEQFQVIQDRDGRILIRVRLSDRSSSGILSLIVSEARRRLPDMEISIASVAHIPRMVSGKSALIIREE